MLKSKVKVIRSIKPHPGNIVVITSSNEMSIVNVYKMKVYKNFSYEVHGCAGLVFINDIFALCGKIINS